MKKKDIKVGGRYVAKVSGKLTTVRVDAIRTRSRNYVGASRKYRDQTVYDVTNLRTGRKTTFESAGKFRYEEKKEHRAIDGVLKYASEREAKEATIDEAEHSLADRLRQPRDISTDTSPHLIVVARAGTGKTTTLVEGLKVVKGMPTSITPSPQQVAVWDSLKLSAGKVVTICFVAFNKPIAEELKKRVPAGCEASTMHSMGFKAVLRTFGNIKVNGYRVSDIIAELLERNIRELRKYKATVLSAVEKLVGLCKMNLTGDEHGDQYPEELSRLAAHYDVDLNGEREEVFRLVPQVLERCRDVQKGRCVDFNDMIWLPVVLDLNVYKYDMLLVDEAQDLNRCQQALAQRAGRRLVLCGDPRQAIYGFAGADSDSIPRMQRELEATDRGCVTLPLTVTRRCGRAIVAEAQQIVPDFEAFESNGQGTISNASYNDDKDEVTNTPKSYAKLVGDGDMILCRVNAPLVSQCFRFIKQGRKATIQGRDVATSLVSTVKKLMKGYSRPIEVETERTTGSSANPTFSRHHFPRKDDNQAEIVELTARLDNWLNTETTKENAKRNPNEARLITLQDRYDCLMCFTDGAATMDDVIRKIESVFTDDKDSPGIRLSSIHKAKGLEAKRVFFLVPEGAQCPHPMARSAWQREQEMNLRYVAITRAIEELVYVS